MTAIVQSLNAAGVRLPTLQYRIWHWLKDHSEKTSEEIRAALNLGYPVPSICVKMERAGVLKAYSDVTRPKGPKGIQYKIKRYSVVDKTTYEPPERKAHKKKVKTAQTPLPAAVVVALPAVITAPVFNPAIVVEPLSLTDCKALYVYLHGVFK